MPEGSRGLDERSEFLSVVCPCCRYEVRSERFKAGKAGAYEQALLTADLGLQEPLLLRCPECETISRLEKWKRQVVKCPV
jgi:hypothetical protein